MNAQTLHIVDFGQQDYQACVRAMQDFTVNRSQATIDQLWLVEHPPVFTQGVAGKAEHLLNPNGIPVIKSDRGGQITYHGPGQLIFYTLIDLKRLDLNISSLVRALEQCGIDLLEDFGIAAHARRDAPGIYVNDEKIASLGLRVKRFCSYHGMALNVDMDLTPFSYINPCGYAGLPMTQLSALSPNCSAQHVRDKFISRLQRKLGYNHVKNLSRDTFV